VTSDPQGFVRIGDLVLFNAVDAAHGRELWRTDGTAEGTVLVEDIHPGEPWGVVAAYQGVAAAGDVAYFAADDGVHGAELWRSDGTSDGTQLVGDLNPGPAGSDPAPLWVVGSTIYFVAHDAQAGVELWRSDGTAAGTARVVDINPGRGDASPQLLGMFHGLIILSADDGVHGCELWATDGTAEGTRLVKDTNPSAACYERPPPSYPFLHDIYLGPRAFTDAGDVFFFTTDRALWKSDGSEAGTEALHSFYDCSGFEVFRCPPTCLSVVDDMLYFQGDDYTAGREPWHSDGTPEGTAIIADLLATPCHMSSYGDDCSSMACSSGPATGARRAPFWSDSSTRAHPRPSLTFSSPPATWSSSRR
jgi:ELWxxDGT repeat protein